MIIRWLLPGIIFGAAFLTPFIIKEYPELPDNFAYLPDFAIALVAAALLPRLVLSGRWALIPLSHVLVFSAFAYVVVAGIVLNNVSTLVAIGGVRTYLKYIPLFLIPFAFAYSSSDIRRSLIVVLGFVVLQVPFTVWQRFVEFSDSGSGDPMSGTLSSTTSIAMLSAIAIVSIAGYYLHKKISLTTASVLAGIALIPAALGETKITPILILIGGGGLLFACRSLISRRQLTAVSATGGVLLIAFIGIYDALYANTDARDANYLGLMTSTQYTLDSYNYRGLRAESFSKIRKHPELVDRSVQLTDDDAEVGRFDSVRMPFDAFLPDETVRFLIGLGIGNTSTSFGDGGEFLIVKYRLGGAATTVSQLLRETGLIGTICFALMVVVTALQSLALCRAQTEDAVLGAIVFAISGIYLVCFVYANLFNVSELMLVYTFLAGLVAAKQRVSARAPVQIRGYPHLSQQRP